MKHRLSCICAECEVEFGAPIELPDEMSRHRVPYSVRAMAKAAYNEWESAIIRRAIRANFGGIFNPPKGEDPPNSMVNMCPLCMGKVQRGRRTTHLMSVHKRTREDAKSLIEKYCGK